MDKRTRGHWSGCKRRGGQKKTAEIKEPDQLTHAGTWQNVVVEEAWLEVRENKSAPVPQHTLRKLSRAKAQLWLEGLQVGGLTPANLAA